MIESHFKVLIVVTRGTVGGAQTSVFNLARQLARSPQADVTVGSGEGEHLALRCRAAGIEHVRFEYLRRSLNPIYAVRSIAEFVRHFNQEQYDVVHINSSNALFAALAAKLSKKKPWIVFTFRGLSLLDEHYEMSSLKRRLYIWIYRILLAFVDEPVFVSFENFETATRMGLVKEGAGTVIYNGLDPEELVFEDRSEARQALAELSGAKITDETFLIGSIGRLAYQKNYEFLIDQIADLSGKHPLLKVVIIGDGPLHKTILGHIRREGLEQIIYLPGEIPEASRYMRGLDLFVLPSRYEGLSVTLIETLFAGVSVLASDVGGAREQFEQAPFQVYPLDNSEEFQKRLSRLIEHADVRAELAEANKNRANDFHISKTAAGYRSVYNEAHNTSRSQS